MRLPTHARPTPRTPAPRQAEDAAAKAKADAEREASKLAEAAKKEASSAAKSAADAAKRANGDVISALDKRLRDETAALKAQLKAASKSGVRGVGRHCACMLPACMHGLVVRGPAAAGRRPSSA